MRGKTGPIRYECFACAAPAEGRTTQCGVCGALGTVIEVDEVPSEPEGPVPIGAICAHDVLPLLPRPLRTGREAWDTALGGGVVRPSTVLVAGPKGVGKTTSTIAVAVHLARALRGKALFASAEMPIAHVRMVTARLGFGAADLRALYVLGTADVENVLVAIDEIGPAVIVWDSLQRFRWRGELGQLVEVLTRAKAKGESANAVTLVISHVTKEGEIWGSSGIGHDSDVELFIRPSEPGVVLVECPNKNRFAPTPASATERLHG